MDHRNIARVLLSLLCAVQGLATLGIDLNRTHATNPKWTDVLRSGDAVFGIGEHPGTIEFDAPAGAQIGVVGIRSPPALTFTTLPPLAN